MSTLTKLGDIPVAVFLRDYWQQQPLLIRQALPNFQSPIDADELAGLAMEDFIESRLVMAATWEVKHGPFSEQELSSLPDVPWTLLVQGVDQLNPDIAELLNQFRFLPSWQLDDIMVSYATDGGGVGPHYDHYDVFLLQAQGCRRWKIGPYCHSNELLDGELAILKDFECQHDYLLEPGDMLYLPAKIAHWGIAQGECMTFSIGFRAPSIEEFISHYCDDRLDALSSMRRISYGDRAKDNYQIPESVVDTLRQELLTLLDNKQSLANWFGRYSTLPRYENDAAGDLDSVSQIDFPVQKQAAVRFAYFIDGDRAQLFANGHCWTIALDLARALCSGEAVSRDQVEDHSNSDVVALVDLFNKGLITVC